ncbi:MAG: helix-turn-helix transcriptional regulator [Cyanobacteria bacterium P01_D01_bin.36]
MIAAVKIRRTEEWNIPDLPERLSGAFEKSEKSVLQMCREAGISSNFWYQMIRGNKTSIKHSTLKELCGVLDLTLEELSQDGEIV